MSSWQTGNVSVNGVGLHYTRTGGEKPAVVLAHGFSDSGLCWTPVAQALEAEYDIIMIDARGHGQSDAPLAGYGPVEHAADICGVIEQLGLQRPAVLGHSMGGTTTIALAGLYPNVTGAILIEDSAPFNTPPATIPGTEDRLARIHQWIQEIKTKTREEMIATQRAGSPDWPEAEFGPWADAKLAMSLNVLNRSENAAIDWPHVLPQISCPALLIIADPERGAGVTDERARELQAIIPQLQVAHIAGAGHNIRREQFAHFIAVVRPFLAAWAAS
jgi:pimeloyl-ACP methyl ester carboxylesterase